MKEFNLTVSTSDGNLFEGDVERISLRGADGDFAILADHIPFVTVVKAGRVKVTEAGGKTFEADCGEGILTVSGKETVLLTSFFEKVQPEE